MIANPSMPHRNLVKILFLSGLPLTSDNHNIKSITTILRRMQCNIHDSIVYLELREEAIDSPEAMDMMTQNTEIYARNQYSSGKKEPPVIHADALRGYYEPKYAEALISKYTTGRMPAFSKAVPLVFKMFECKAIRQQAEVMLMHGTDDDTIAKAISKMMTDKDGSKVNSHIIRIFSEYYWSSKSGSGWENSDIDSMACYLSLNMRNTYYNYHRRMLVMPPGEILLVYGITDDDMVAHYNRVIYGTAAAEIITKLRAGERVPNNIISLYTQAAANMIEAKKVDDLDGERDIMRDIFENMEIIKKKRLSMDELQGTISEEEPEKDEPAKFKR